MKHGISITAIHLQKETEDEIIESLSKSYINGLTVLGGEPFEVRNQREILPFIKRIRKRIA